MAFLKQVFYGQTTDTYTFDREGVGRLRWEDPDNCYRFVFNPTTNYTPAAGDVVTHQFTDGTTSLQNIYKPATAQLGYMAGVVCAAMSASTGTNPKNYGWIQVFGLNSSVSVTPVNTQTTSNPVAGNSLIAVNSATYAATGQAMGIAAVYKRKLELLDVVLGSTAAQVCNVLVQCL